MRAPIPTYRFAPWRSRHRGLNFVAMLSLSVGIAMSVALTSVSSAVLVRPLPYEKPDNLVMIWRQAPGPVTLDGFLDPRDLAREILTPGMVTRWRGQPLPFEDFAVLESWQTGWSPRVDLIAGGDIERLRGTSATANLFDVLGVRAALGRTFLYDEEGVAVISDALWHRRFGADPSVIGRKVTVAMGRTRERRVLEIIGVLPKAFQFTYPEGTDFWVPLTWRDIASEPRFGLMYRAVARLKADMPLQTAEAVMQAFRDPADRTSRGPARYWLESVHDYAVGPSRNVFWLVSALTLIILLSGASNAATVFSAAIVSRQREMQTRRALGASRRQLFQQIFAECAAIAIVAGFVGVTAVALLLPALRQLLPAGLPGVDGIRVDVLTLTSVFAAVMVSTAIAGLVPAWLSVRFGAHLHFEDSHSATATQTGLRLRRGLLCIQFALVSALLITGSMLVRSFWNVLTVDKGFAADAHVYAAEIQLMNPGHRDQGFQVFESDLLQRARALAYVEAASLTSAVPLRGVDFVRRLRKTDDQQISTNVRNVDAGYFDVMRIPILRGRALAESDTAEKQWVAVVSKSLAETLFPGEDPIGQFLEGSSGTRIVGVAADVRGRSMTEQPMPAFYWPRTLQTTNQIWLLVRTTMTADRVATDLRRIVREVYPLQPVQRFATLEEIVNDSVADRRAYATIASAFAIGMLLLAGIGLCGHLTHMVTERSRDLAIRSALGASLQHQRWSLVAHVVQSLIAGLVLSIVAVYLLLPLISPFLYQVPRFDAVSCGISTIFVAALTVVATILPARRIAKLDPAITLRSI